MTYRFPIHVGDRVALAPHTDLWMAGCRFGTALGEFNHPERGVFFNIRLDTGALVSVWKDDLLGAVGDTPFGAMPSTDEPEPNEYGFVCAEFDEDGSCIHSDHMNAAGLLSGRNAYPYALGVRSAGESAPTYLHFDTPQSAAWFASLCASTTIVTRWVALVEPEYLSSAVVPGWRQVSWFSCERPNDET
jgi:hypothetical protein